MAWADISVATTKEYTLWIGRAMIDTVRMIFRDRPAKYNPLTGKSAKAGSG